MAPQGVKAACLLLCAYTFMQAGEAAALCLGCALPASSAESIAASRLPGTCKVGSAEHVKEVVGRVMLGQAGDKEGSIGGSLGRARLSSRVTSPHLRMRMSADHSDYVTRNDNGGRGGYPEGITTFIAECHMPTDRGMYRLRSYRYKGAKMVWRNGERVLEWTEMEPVVMYHGELRGQEGVVVRVHDQCFTSEVLGSKRCDCKDQLDMSLSYIQTHGGAVIYMPQEVLLSLSLSLSLCLSLSLSSLSSRALSLSLPASLSLSLSLSLSVRVCVCACVCVHMHVCIYTCMHVYTHACMYTPRLS